MTHNKVDSLIQHDSARFFNLQKKIPIKIKFDFYKNKPTTKKERQEDRKYHSNRIFDVLLK